MYFTKNILAVVRKHAVHFFTLKSTQFLVAKFYFMVYSIIRYDVNFCVFVE